MPPMPYTMEIGPIFSLLNDYLEDPQHMVTMLTELRDPNVQRLTQTEFFSKATVTGLPSAPVAHIEQEWFGWQPGTDTPYPFDPNHPASTGWWTRWYGNAGGITRETLVRALEVALGVPHHPTEDVSPTRHWRVQLIWTCGAPTFQGWVSWQWNEDDPADGFVVVTFTTPGNGHPLYATPHRPPTVGGPANDYEDPAQIVGNYGMWVIGEDKTDVLRPQRKRWHHLGNGVLPDWPNAFVHTHGDVVVVAPAEVDGGVLRAGRSW